MELARDLGVTPATVTYAVKRLLAAGLVVETGHARSTGGKRASLLRLNNRARWSVGCTLEEDRLSVVAVDRSGALRSQLTMRLAGTGGPAEVSAAFPRALATMKPGRGGLSTTGVGLALPALGSGRGEETAAHLEESLGVAVVSAPVPVCAALGSSWSGELAEQGLSGAVHLAAGTGITLLLDGRPLPTPVPGTLDHALAGPATMGPAGSPASAAGLAAAAREAGWSPGDGETPERPEREAVRIAVAAAAGDPLARELVEAASTALAESVWTVAGAVGLEEMVVTGAWPQAAPGLVHLAADRHLAPRREATGRSLRLVVSQVLPHPEAVGAAVLALQTFLEPRLARADP